MINFYHMEGCPHCVTAKSELKSLIDSCKITEFSQKEAPIGVKGFPYFELVDSNGKVLKTSTGWAGKDTLFGNLGTYEKYESEPTEAMVFNCMKESYIPPRKEAVKEGYESNPKVAKQVLKKPVVDNISESRNFFKEKKLEMFEMENFPVVEHMETIPTDVLYHHHTGGYSKLSNCWVKQPDYTA